MLNIEENKLDAILGNVHILLEQGFCRTHINTCVKCAIDIFSR